MNACTRVTVVAGRLVQGCIAAVCSYALSASLPSLPAGSEAIPQHRSFSSQPGSSGSSSGPSTSPIDSFTAGLQKKTEQELLDLIQKARAEKLQGDEEAVEEESEEAANPETGELYGPRGKEPTRFGDWELKGKCVDF